jgi:agmatine deiminase
VTIDAPLREYRMPAEWEPHTATWLAWPHKHSDWPGKFTPIPWVYTEIVRALARRERVNLIVGDAKMRDSAADKLAIAGVNIANVSF